MTISFIQLKLQRRVFNHLLDLLFVVCLDSFFGHSLLSLCLRRPNWQFASTPWVSQIVLASLAYNRSLLLNTLFFFSLWSLLNLLSFMSTSFHQLSANSLLFESTFLNQSYRLQSFAWISSFGTDGGVSPVLNSSACMLGGSRTMTWRTQVIELCLWGSHYLNAALRSYSITIWLKSLLSFHVFLKRVFLDFRSLIRPFTAV